MESHESSGKSFLQEAWPVFCTWAVLTESVAGTLHNVVALIIFKRVLGPIIL